MITNKKNKKIVITVLLTIVLGSAFVFSLLGKNKTSAKEKELLDVLIWGEKTDLFDHIFQKFEAKYPSIKIQVSFVSENYYEDFMREQISSEKKIADVIFMKPKYDTFLSLETKGRLTDLTGEIYLDNYQSENLKIYEVNKCQYAIPFISNKLVACYNLSVLEKLNYEIPKNAQDLEKIFREALRREITPIIFGGEDEKGFYEMYIQWLMLVLRNFNQTSFFANDLQNGKVRADDPVLLEYMELIYNLSQKGYFSNKNLLINTAEAMDAFESDKAVVIMSDIWSLYQQLGDDFEKKYMPGSLVVEEGEANEINSLSFILGIDSKSDAKENANLLIEFLSTDVNEDDIELPEGMHLLNTEADENSLYKKEYDYEVYMDKCAWWIKEPFKDMTARLLSDQKIEDVIASTEELFESLTIPTYICTINKNNREVEKWVEKQQLLQVPTEGLAEELLMYLQKKDMIFFSHTMVRQKRQKKCSNM